MTLFDNHNHSQFSFDGKRTSVEASAMAAARHGLGGLAFTEHCDFFIPPAKKASGETALEWFDVSQQQAEIERVQATVPVKILKGIEIGLHEDSREQIRKTLTENRFDQVIASVHYLDGVDPYHGEYYIGKDWKEAYGKYLETILREMTWLEDFDIMGHYDYIVRYAPYPQNSIRYKDFADLFDAMFTYLIQEGKALEINTKSYQGHRGRVVLPDKDVLLRYRELGGEIISLGSDSHEPERVGADFGHFAALLKSHGFRWSAHYEERRLCQLAL